MQTILKTTRVKEMLESSEAVAGIKAELLVWGFCFKEALQLIMRESSFT